MSAALRPRLLVSFMCRIPDYPVAGRCRFARLPKWSSPYTIRRLHAYEQTIDRRAVQFGNHESAARRRLDCRSPARGASRRHLRLHLRRWTGGHARRVQRGALLVGGVQRLAGPARPGLFAPASRISNRGSAPCLGAPRPPPHPPPPPPPLPPPP